MRGFGWLIVLALAALTACPVPEEEHAGGTSGDEPAAGTQPAASVTADAQPPEQVDPAEIDPGGLSELVEGPDGELRYVEVELPEGWPAELPLVEDARVIFREHALYSPDRQTHIIMETLIPHDEVGEFYRKQFELNGWRRLESSRSPGFINMTYLGDGQVVDVNAKHVPEELPGSDEIENVNPESTFEGTVIKIHLLPAGNLEHFSGAVEWYNIDDTPEDFPLKDVPRYPGGEIYMVSYAEGDHAVLQQIVEDGDLNEVVKFYSDLYSSRRGMEVEVLAEDDEFHQIEFRAGDRFIRVSASQNAEHPERVLVDVYMQQLATE